MFKKQSVAQDNSPRSRDHGRSRIRFGVLVAVGSIVALVVLAIVIDAALSYNKVHAGVSISGHDVGGLTRDEATARITGLVETAQQSKIVLTSGDKNWDVLPSEVGATMDVAGAVSAAMAVSRESNFFVDLGRRFKLYFSHVDVPLVGTVDTALLDKMLGGVARQLDTSPVNAGLSIQGGSIRVIEGQNGSVVDQATLREQLTALLLTLHATQLTVPLVTKEPAVQAVDNQEAQKQAETMMSGPVVLTDGDKSWTLTSDQIAGYMDFTSQDENGVATLVPYISAQKMQPFLDGIAPQVATDPVDATFQSDAKTAWVVPGVPGKALDPEKTVEAITAASLGTTGRTAEAQFKTTDPNLTTAEAEAMGVKDLLSSYTTPSYVGTANRQVNVRITTEYASNVFLAPGEEYNFDKQIGPRTAARGYKPAPGIVGGGELEDVLGGGICQVSTTLFNAVFEAGLQVLERHNHSLYISHYPNGRDATVAGGGGKNFRFKNDTGHYIWIRGTSNGVTTTFNIFGTNDGRTVKASFSGFSYGAARTQVTVLNPSLGPGATHVKISGQSGRSCSETRVITYADGTTHTDIFKSDYPMIPKTIEVGPSTTTTTIMPTTTTTEPGTTSTVTTQF